MERNISYQVPRPIEEVVAKLYKKVEMKGDLPHATVVRQKELIDALASFPLGVSLLQQGGALTAFATHYIVTHPLHKRVIHPFEEYILNYLPVAVATQQRFIIFRQAIQRYSKKGSKLANIPAGMMSVFLYDEYFRGCSLVGIDIDPDVLVSAQTFAKERGFSVSLHQRDAWDLQIENEFDLICSNGLNFYESNPDKVVDLYREFHKALKPGGILIVSSLTCPPNFGAKSEWKIDQISLEGALIQRIIFSDILESKWQSYRTTKETEQQLKAAHFTVKEILFDKAHIFPTMVAQKSCS